MIKSWWLYKKREREQTDTGTHEFPVSGCVMPCTTSKHLLVRRTPQRQAFDLRPEPGTKTNPFFYNLHNLGYCVVHTENSHTSSSSGHTPLSLPFSLVFLLLFVLYSLPSQEGRYSMEENKTTIGSPTERIYIQKNYL